MIRLGGVGTTLYVGGQSATRAYLGTVLAWEATKPPQDPAAGVPESVYAGASLAHDWTVINPGVTVFLNADGTGVPQVGDRIGYLADAVGGLHATQANAAFQPILRQDAHGNYYLEFDGVDDRLENAAGVAISGEEDSVMYIAARWANPADGSYRFFLSHGGASTNRARMLGRTTAAAGGHPVSGVWGANDHVLSAVTDTLPFIHGAEFWYTFGGGRFIRSWYRDTVEEQTSALATDSLAPLRIGTNAGANQFAIGDFYGAFISSRRLDEAQRATLHAYLTGLYGERP